MQREPKTKRLPHIISVCLLLALAIPIFRVSPTPLAASETSANDAEVREIDPGSSTSVTLRARAKATFTVSVTAGSLLRFSIDKEDLLLSTILYGPTGEKLLEHVSHDFEVIDLSFPAQSAGTYRIELLSRESKDARQFDLKLQSLTPLTGVNLKDAEARQALARAEVLRAESTEAAIRQAIQQYDEATQICSSLSDFASAANVSLKSGNLLLDLSDYGEALKHYQNANAFAEKTGDWVARAKVLSRIARVESLIGKNSSAEGHIDQTLALFKSHDESLTTNAYGEALSIQGEILYSKGALDAASEKLTDALKIFKQDRKAEAKAHLSLGQISGSMGYLERAETESTAALGLYRALEDKRGEASALISLGLVNSFGNESKAIELFGKARNIFSSLGDKTSEGIALNALGQTSENLHDNSAALDYYEQAMAIFEEKGFKDALPSSLLRIGTLYFDKDLNKALDYAERCLKLSEQIGDARAAALARIEIARVYTAQKHYDLASAEYQKVLRFYQSTKDLRGEATALNPYGDFLLEVGEKQKALASFDRALSLSDSIQDKELHIGALYGLARAHLQLGSPERALALSQQSLKEIEEFRASVESPDLRTSYFAGVQRNYKLCIDILMQLERRHPGEGNLTQAFLVSENSRARLLRELVIESQSGKRGGAASDLLQRERELRGRFRTQARYRMMLASDPKNSAEIAALDRELAEIKASFQEVETQLRQQDFGVSPPEPLKLDQIQHELRDDTSILLEFSLGDERSYLFVVTFNSIEAYVLPGLNEVEDVVNEFMESIKTRDRQIDNEKAARLSQMLFGPVADKLGNRRLVLVTEGGLQALAFDPLPVPARQPDGPTTSKSLVETNDIVFEPSISTLAAIRKPRSHNDSPNKLVAVIADPVLNRSDERVQNSSVSSGTALAATNSNSDQPVERSSEISVRAGALTRLAHASEEADAIVAAAPWGTTMVARDFAANRETVTSPELGQYQIVHFATHGFFNNEHPELSGIMLTTIERNGANADGVMFLQDIYNLNLSAELTVLSACETARGKDVKGEGLVGLTHSFLSAGSKSVVASLWKVDDRATAVFMAKFYEAMLQEGLAPAAALREAKLRMMHEKQWNAPYYWAGFVLQGEYENHIQVDRHSSMRLAIVLLLLLGLSGAGLVLYRRRKPQFFPPNQAEENTIR